ncbi:hypothetical protein DFP73DRAFT_201939 [Morchella snyderi]|nr:hypothetical protein DFP73DRAFT_201939 [Morchella snyderi]
MYLSFRILYSRVGTAHTHTASPPPPLAGMQGGGGSRAEVASCFEAAVISIFVVLWAMIEGGGRDSVCWGGWWYGLASKTAFSFGAGSWGYHCAVVRHVIRTRAVSVSGIISGVIK